MGTSNKQILVDLFHQQGKRWLKQKGERFFSINDPVTHLFWVVKGEARLIRHSASGNQICLQATNNNLLAEASLYTKTYHCDGTALSDCDGFKIKKENFTRALQQDQTIQIAYTSYLSESLRELRTLLEIRSFRRVSERLDAWITIYGNEALKNQQTNHLAQQIDVSPAALYREMSNRRYS